MIEVVLPSPLRGQLLASVPLLMGLAFIYVGVEGSPLFMLPGAIGAAISVIWSLRQQQRWAQAQLRLEQLLSALVQRDEAVLRQLLRQPQWLGTAAGAARGLQQMALEWPRAASLQRQALVQMTQSVSSLGSMLVEQSDGVRAVARVLDSDLTLHEEINGQVDGLTAFTEESSTSVLQMVAVNNELRESFHNLAQSVQETTSALEQMTFSSREVARNIEELSTAAEETAASMNEMDISIRQVEGNATETSKLSDTVTRDAETGVAAIKQTIEGIDKIKGSSRIAAEVIGFLGQKISEIGNILNVIDDVAEQTNLLALNAAIIAAQAGEHGRGFAVVADEIKALAERTGASTKEIAELVKTIQEQSRRATGVMNEGVDNVEAGVRLGHNAEDALRKIVDSARRSTLMIQAIASATVEQAKGSKQVTDAISRIAETVQQIAHATADQAKGNEHIMQSAERMRGITQQVERSAEEQSRGGRQVTESIDNIRAAADKIARAHQAKSQSDSQLKASAVRVTESGERSMDLLRGFELLLSKSQVELDPLLQSRR